MEHIECRPPATQSSASGINRPIPLRSLVDPSEINYDLAHVDDGDDGGDDDDDTDD